MKGLYIKTQTDVTLKDSSLCVSDGNERREKNIGYQYQLGSKYQLSVPVQNHKLGLTLIEFLIENLPII